MYTKRGPGSASHFVMNRTARLRQSLLDWFAQARRDLPWRHTTDPYAIWISEIMLQQTRVETVIPYYDRFLKSWPTVQDLAAADPESVRASWSGLGYYRRARLMLQAAHAVVDRHGGALPDTEAALRALPGFGRYTAGAVASIAFDRPVPAVDGNVTRVLARLDAIEGDVTRGQPNKQIWAAASKLSNGPRAGDLNQSLIELGALLCTPRNPRCPTCPVRSECGAERRGRVHEIPPPRKRAARKRVEMTALMVQCQDGFVLTQRPDTGVFASLWTPPFLDGHLDADAASDEALRALDWELDGAREAGQFTHVLTHRELVVRLVSARCGPQLPPSLRRVTLEQLGALGIPSVTARALDGAFPDHPMLRDALPGRRTPV
jgi:A/G-specific adenine glycosylase